MCLVYARFDDSTKDFPIDAEFAQVSLVKNPTSFGTTSIYTGSTFSALKSIKLIQFQEHLQLEVYYSKL